MVTDNKKVTYINIDVAVQRTGLSRDQVRQVVARRLVMEPLQESDLVELRRVRRLQELGVNLQGIEVILHMRRRIEALRGELIRWQPLDDQTGRQQVEERWQRLLQWRSD
jgi:hypothetical protein